MLFFIYKDRVSHDGKFSIYPTAGILGSDTRRSIHIGKNVSLQGWLIADDAGRIKIGDFSSVAERSVIRSRLSVSIGKYVMISSDVYIEDSNGHSVNYKDRRVDAVNREKYKGTLLRAVSKAIVIEDDVWIGRRSMIMKGVKIGKGSIIGAGSVVTHNVPPFSLAAGNPAKVIKYLK